LTDKVPSGYCQPFFSFFFGKTGAGAGKAELPRHFFALSQLSQPLRAQGAPTG
jgi:hypothetical protein